MVTAAFIVASVVGGAATTAGGWLFGKVVHLGRKQRELEARVEAVESTRTTRRR